MSEGAQAAQDRVLAHHEWWRRRADPTHERVIPRKELPLFLDQLFDLVEVIEKSNSVSSSSA